MHQIYMALFYNTVNFNFTGDRNILDASSHICQPGRKTNVWLPVGAYIHTQPYTSVNDAGGKADEVSCPRIQ